MSHPSRHLLRNVVLCLLVSQAGRLLVALPAAKNIEWQLHDVAMHLNVVCLLVIAIWFIPYRELAAKCVAIAWLGFEILPFFQSIVRIWIFMDAPRFLTMQAALTTLFVAFYEVRSYRHESDELDDKNIFMCRLKPRSLQDVLMAMLPSGLGGIAVYYQGRFWHYKRGVLIAGEFESQSRYVVTRAGLPKKEAIQQLNALVGTRWTITKNCLTMLYATVKLGRPLMPIKSGGSRRSRH